MSAIFPRAPRKGLGRGAVEGTGRLSPADPVSLVRFRAGEAPSPSARARSWRLPRHRSRVGAVLGYRATGSRRLVLLGAVRLHTLPACRACGNGPRWRSFPAAQPDRPRLAGFAQRSDREVPTSVRNCAASLRPEVSGMPPRRGSPLADLCRRRGRRSARQERVAYRRRSRRSRRDRRDPKDSPRIVMFFSLEYTFIPPPRWRAQTSAALLHRTPERSTHVTIRF